jgi:MFS-type transporter involved in bile tolerance (Atg22 family)
MGILAASMLLTMLAPEQPLCFDLAQHRCFDLAQHRHKGLRGAVAQPVDWQPFLRSALRRLLLMTALFTAVILGVGVSVVRFAIPLVGKAGHFAVPCGAARGRPQGIAPTAAVIGIVGLLAMVIAVVLGVWVSVRISIGEQAARANPSFTWWIVSRLAYLVGSGNLASFAVYFLQGRLGFVREQAARPASMLMLLVGVTVLAFSLVAGWVADRVGHKRLLVAAGLLAFLGALVAIAVPNLAVLYAGGCLIGAATGLFYTANWALGTELVPKAEAGRYLGISNLAGAGAGAVGAYIGGPIADYITAQVPDVPGLGYVLLFAIYGVMFLVSVVALHGVKEPEAA